MAKSNNTGCGCLGLLGFVFLVGMCSDGDSPSSTASLYTPPPTTSSASVATAPEPENFYLHGSLNVRTGPGKDYDVSRTLTRGERVRLGPKDATGWAPVYSTYGTTPEGYLYRASDLVRSSAPAPRRSPQREQHTIPSGDGYINSRGNWTPSPVYARSAPAGASAKCRDGTYSFSASRRGTCSHHGGVAQWL